MSISSTISQYAATNPAVAVAVSKESTQNALLSSMNSDGSPAAGASAAGGVLSALSQQQTEVETLLEGASDPNLGRNIDIRA
jgi:hypothetical protein